MAKDAKKATKLIDELRVMDAKQLTEKIAELKKQLNEHYRSNHAGELPSTAVIGKVRRGIAQAETLKSQKLRQAALEAQTKETK